MDKPHFAKGAKRSDSWNFVRPSIDMSVYMAQAARLKETLETGERNKHPRPLMKRKYKHIISK